MSGLVELSADARSKTISQNFRCRAWVNFNGTGTVAINGSGNISSVVDTGSGNYQINMTQAMPDDDYCAVAGAAISGNYTSVKTTANLRDRAIVDVSVSNSWTDAFYVGCAIFR